MSYAMLCPKHTRHNEECPACRLFDQTVKGDLSAYTIPPQHHISVRAPEVRAWMKGIFGH